MIALAWATTVSAQPAPLPTRTFETTTFPAHWARRPLLDEARAAARVDLAWERFGVLGEGACVCVVDTGVDLAHRDLRDADDHTRVDWLLDLDASPRGSEPELEARFGGAVYRQDELDAMYSAGDPTLPTDWHGHGTAIASAALGDDAPPGVSTPGPFAGVAPRARLIVVRALRRGSGGFADDDIVRGATFCGAVADPGHTVVVLSLGGHDGAHDGTSPIERALDVLVHRGLTIVVAAGNDGGRAFHAAARVADATTTALTLRVPSPEDVSDAHVAIAIRGAAHVALRSPDGLQAEVRTPGEQVRIVTVHGTLDASALREGVIDLVLSGDATRPLVGGDFIVAITGPAHVDAWIVSSELGTAFLSPAFVGPHVVPGEEVSMPATSESVIAVGASVSRATLVTTDGSPTLTLDADDEGRALFSARGPSASGTLRPDVLAPGGWIVAARSHSVDPADPEALVHGHASDWSRLSQPDERLAIAGTSVSAAIVAGALALAVEVAPLDPERDRARLAFTATHTGDAAFTPARGFGALDALAFLETRSASPTASVSGGALSASRAFVTPLEADLALAFRASSVPTDAWVTFTRDGEVLARAPLRAGIARARVHVGAAIPGSTITFVAASAEGVVLASTETPVALDDDGDLGVALGATCRVGPRRAMPGAFALLPLLVAVTLRSRRWLASRRRSGIR